MNSRSSVINRGATVPSKEPDMPQSIRPPHPALVRFLPVLALLLPCACTDATPPDDLAPLPTWSVSQDLRVGSVDDPDYSLTRFPSLEVGRDGRIYTVHPMEQIVRVFGPDGTLAGTIGGRGDGPGEFQMLGRIGWVGDSLWALDFSGHRFSFFDADGEFLSSFSVPFVAGKDPELPQPPRASGILSDGSVYGSPPAFSSQIEEGTLTHHRVLLMSRDGQVVDSVFRVPFGRSQWAIYDPDDRGRLTTFTRQPYGDGPLWSFFEDEMSYAILRRESPATAEEAVVRLEKITVAGDTVFARDYRYTPVPVTPAEADSVLDFHVGRWADVGPFRGVAKGRLEEWAGRGFYRPAFQTPIVHMVPAGDGGFWLESGPSRPGSTEWYYLDGDGTPLGKVELPENVQVLEATAETLWGVETDDLDVPYLVRYRVGGEG
jgi:hypothetical protein